MHVACCDMLSTSGFVDDVTMFSYHGTVEAESSTMLFFEELRQVAVPVRLLQNLEQFIGVWHLGEFCYV